MGRIGRIYDTFDIKTIKFGWVLKGLKPTHPFGGFGLQVRFLGIGWADGLYRFKLQDLSITSYFE